MNPKNFFAELKRRNVYKVAVAGWLLVQVASIFPQARRGFLLLTPFGLCIVRNA